MTEIYDLIKEVETKLTSSNTDIEECLKKTLIISRHFNDLKIFEWIKSELKGYDNKQDVPEYRNVKSIIYEHRIDTHPIGFGQIVSTRYDKTLDIFTFPYFFNIKTLVKDAQRQNEIKYNITHFDDNNAISLPIKIRGSDLQRVIMEINLKLLDYIHEKQKIISLSPYESPIMKIFNRFHRIAKQLEERYDKRPPLIINDEYDVQYLLFALLNLEFDSIQKEEYGPQFAGKRPRVDFFLRFESIAIEVKRIRDKNHAKSVHQEIIIDKEYYSKNKQITDLYFFIYDPNSFITERIDFIDHLTENIPKQFSTFKIIIKPDF